MKGECPSIDNQSCIILDILNTLYTDRNILEDSY